MLLLLSGRAVQIMNDEPYLMFFMESTSSLANFYCYKNLLV